MDKSTKTDPVPWVAKDSRHPTRWERSKTVEFDDLAFRLAMSRPAAVENELARFVRHATAAGATPLLVKILSDNREPDIVRQRAFGRIAAELDRPRHTTYGGATYESQAA